jgi:hypothetical protein
MTGGSKILLGYTCYTQCMSEGKIIEGRFPQHQNDGDGNSKGEPARLFKIGPKGREADPQDSVFTQKQIAEVRKLNQLRHQMNQVYTAIGVVDLTTGRESAAKFNEYQRAIEEGRTNYDSLVENLLKSTAKDWSHNKARYLALIAILEDYLAQRLNRQDYGENDNSEEE